MYRRILGPFVKVKIKKSTTDQKKSITELLLLEKSNDEHKIGNIIALWKREELGQTEMLRCSVGVRRLNLLRKK